MNSLWNDDLLFLCNSSTTGLIYDVAGDSDHNNWDASCTTVSTMQSIFSSTNNTSNNMEDDETEEKKELDHQRLVFILLLALSLMKQKTKFATVT